MIIAETDNFRLKLNNSNANAILKIKTPSNKTISVTVPGPILETSAPPVLRFASNTLLGSPPTIQTPAEEYKVWAAHWVYWNSGPPGGTLTGNTLHWNYENANLPLGDTTNNPFKTIVPSVRPSFVNTTYNIDCSGLSAPNNNAYRGPGSVFDDCSHSDLPSVIETFTKRIIGMPSNKRVLHFYPWASDFPSVNVNFENYYKNKDGITFNNERFSSLWPNQQKLDHNNSYNQLLLRSIQYAVGNSAASRLNDTQIGASAGSQAIVDYVMGDHENHPIVFSLDGIHMIGNGQTASHPALINGKFSDLTPNPRTISAQISGVSFLNSPRNISGFDQIPNSSFAVEFMQNYRDISSFLGFDVSTGFTFAGLLQDDSGIYGSIFGNSGNTFNPSGYLNEKWRTRIIPAWDSAIRNHFEGEYIFKSYNGISFGQNSNLLTYLNSATRGMTAPYFSNYESFPVNSTESRYFKDANGLIVKRRVFDQMKGGNSYYGGVKSILWTPSSGGNNVNSGYFRNPETNVEKFTWHGLYQTDSELSFTSEQLSRFVRVGANKNVAFNQLTFLERRLVAYKSLVYDIANLRLQYRSLGAGDTDFVKNHVPWITKPQNLYGSSLGDLRMWYEVINQLLAHGFEYLSYWIEDNQLFATTTIGKTTVTFEELLDGILKSWYTISGNAKIIPCSNEDGLSSVTVDRLEIAKSMEDIIISGGRIQNTSTRIWRLTAPPSKIYDGKLYFQRFSNRENEQNLPRYITVDTTNVKNGLGVWVVKTGSGRPDYRSFIPTYTKAQELEASEQVSVDGATPELASGSIFSISPYL